MLTHNHEVRFTCLDESEKEIKGEVGFNRGESPEREDTESPCLTDNQRCLFNKAMDAIRNFVSTVKSLDSWEITAKA